MVNHLRINRPLSIAILFRLRRLMCLKNLLLNMDKYGLSSCGSNVFGIKCAPKFWSIEIPSKFVMNGFLGLHRIFRRLWALGLASKGLSNLDSRPRITSVQPLKPALYTHDILMIKKYIYIYLFIYVESCQIIYWIWIILIHNTQYSICDGTSREPPAWWR